MADVEAEAESEEADEDEIDAIGAAVVPELDTDESKSAIEDEQTSKEDGA